MIEITEFGTTQASDGSPARRIDAIDVTSSQVRLRLISLGASIASLETPDADGRFGHVHLRLPSLDEYADPMLNPHLGGSIGRYANRIAQARFPLDGRIVQVAANKGTNQLHGGPDGFDRRGWSIDEAFSTPDGGVATFSLASPDGDQGFPGSVRVSATYALTSDRLRISYAAQSDAPTVMNMTNHGYWNLDGATTVDDHHLALAADDVLPVDADGIPTGPLISVDGTPFDLRARSRLGGAMAAVPPGLDHCFAVRGSAGEVRPAAVLDSPASGRWLAVLTDQPGLQVYTGNGLRAPFHRHGSVSLETQLFPDTPNRPELGSAVLRPGERYVSVTDLRFGFGAPPALADLAD